MDDKTAFICGDINEEAYVKLPTGYGQPGKVCKFRKTTHYEAVHKDNIILVVYADDLPFGPSKENINKVKQQLKQRFEWLT
jgi:hypothetical protein